MAFNVVCVLKFPAGRKPNYRQVKQLEEWNEMKKFYKSHFEFKPT